MPPDVGYSLTLREEERNLLLICLGMAGGNAMYHKDWEMVRTILDFTRTIQERLRNAELNNFVLENLPRVKKAGVQPIEPESCG